MASSSSSDLLIKFAWSLIALSCLLFFGWWTVEIVQAEDTPTILRVAMFSLNAGFLVLIPTLLYRRIRSAKSDPYREINQ